MIRTLAVLGVAVLIAGCASAAAEDPASPSPSPPAEPTASTASATPPPSPTSSEATPTEIPSPDIDLTAEDGDFERVVRDILEYRMWLLRVPHRNELVGRIYHPTCECYETLQETLQEYADAGRRFDQGAPELVESEVLRADDRSASVGLTWRIVGATLVDDDGRVVDRGTGEPNEQVWFLVRFPSGEYRVTSMRAP